jgi:hypothetical protein
LFFWFFGGFPGFFVFFPFFALGSHSEGRESQGILRASATSLLWSS